MADEGKPRRPITFGRAAAVSGVAMDVGSIDWTSGDDVPQDAG